MSKLKVAHKKKPQLRFTGFEKEWVRLKLGDIAEKIQDGTHFSPKLYESGNFKYITSRNIRNGYMDLRNVPFLSDNAHRNIYNRCDVQYSDVLITKDGACTGAVCLNELKEEFSLLSSVAFIRSNKSRAINEYVYQYICCPRGQREIKGSIAGQAITRITLSKLRNFKFFFPSLPEQQKIAEFLSAVDKKIQQLTRKKELLEQYKKGVMQKIFSQEIRFKDENGKDYPDWEEKQLGQLSTINPKSKTLPKTFIYIDLESVERGVLLKEEKLNLKDAPSRAQRLLKKRDVLFQTVRPYQKNNYFFDKTGDYVASTGYAQMRTKGCPHFLYQLLHYQPLVNLIIRCSTGSNYPAINPSDLRTISICVPSHKEQKKIGLFLKVFDIKIRAIANQLEQTQQFKKGLLQQMFV